MHLLNVILCTGLLFSLVECGLDDQSASKRPPAFSFRAYTEGMDIVIQMIEYLLPKLIQGITIQEIPPVDISTMKVYLSNISVSNFTDPKINYTLTSPNKVRFDVTTGLLSLSMSWRAERKNLLVTETDQGELIAEVDSFQTSMEGALGDQLPNGLPSFSLTTCAVTLGKGRLRVRNNSKTFFTSTLSLAGSFSQVIRPIVVDNICLPMKSLVGTIVNAILKAIPAVLNTNLGIGLRYFVEPSVAPTYIEVVLKALLIKDLPPVGQTAPPKPPTTIGSLGTNVTTTPAPAPAKGSTGLIGAVGSAIGGVVNFVTKPFSWFG